MDFNKKLAEMLSKMDEKVLQAKLNAALDMLKKGKTDELAKKINRIDKNELMDKVKEFDESKIKEMNINLDEIKSKITEKDLQNLKSLVGDHGEEIIAKIKDIIK